MTGKKFDEGKSPIVQGCLHYFPRGLLEVSKVSAYGKNKYDVPYSEKNWMSVVDGINRYTDGLGRHFLGEVIDGKLDPESRCRHAAMLAWNALARLELMLIKDEMVTKQIEPSDVAPDGVQTY